MTSAEQKCYDSFSRYFAMRANVCNECFEKARDRLLNQAPIFMHPLCANNYRELRDKFIAERGMITI